MFESRVLPGRTFTELPRGLRRDSIICPLERRSAFRSLLKNNWILLVGVFLAQGIHIGSMYFPLTQDILHVAPMSLGEWGAFLVLASTILLTMEVFKSIKKTNSVVDPSPPKM